MRKGVSGFKGKTHTKEWKLNMSKRITGNKYSLGYKQTQEHIDKASKGSMIKSSPSIDSIKEIIEGLVLSDAHLTEPKTQYQNSRFQISVAWKFKPFAYHLQQLFTDIGIDTTLKSYTRKTGVTSFNLTTIRNTNFTELYHKWYQNRLKIIPKDFVVTPRSLAYIFMGDGSSRYTYKQLIVEVVLCTENFTELDNHLLVNKISRLGVQFRVIKYKKSFRLICKKKSDVMKFMKLVEPYMVKPFHYKLKVPELVNRTISAI